MESERQEAPRTIHRQMADGALWMIVMRWVVRLLGLMSTVILVRVLDPSDFGVMAMAYLSIGFLTNFVDFSVDQAILREANPARDLFDTAWTMQALLGVGLGALTIIFSPLVSDYFRDDRVELVVVILAFQPLILGFENIGVVEFRRKLQFRREFLYWVTKKLVSVITTITLAFSLGNYFALAVAGPVAAAVTVALSFALSEFRPRFSLSSFSKMWNFSKWMMMVNGSWFVAQKGDGAVVGRLSSADDMGLYSVVSTVSYMPIQEIFEPLNRALIPSYAKFNDATEQMYDAFIRVLGLGLTVAIAIGTGMFIVAGDLVTVILGSKWLSAIDTFRWLALAAASMGIILILQDMFTILRRERDAALLHFSHAVTLVATAFVLGGRLGIDVVAPTRTAVTSMFAIAMMFFFLSFIRGRPSILLKLMWRPVLAAGTMAWALSALHGKIFDQPLLSLSADVAIGAFIFVGTQVSLWVLCGRPSGAESDLMGWARGLQTGRKK